MGVPKFFRWCAERYPSVITPFKDSPPPVDNLYLDMNGIIHNCTHPNDFDATKGAPTEKEMIQGMFTYLEKLFNAVQPRKYFLLAVDGVAPRAKMNQQRQRRYRSGYEMMVAREEAVARGEDVPDEKDVFDSNCITPGTPFMVRVSKEFQYFITMKLATDPAWQNCEVIFSGHDNPGEGEHKIVDFIRRRKMQPNYDPNETHCMYGLDADLVMLALSTHEPHFVLLREVVTFGPGSRKERERQEEDAAKGIVQDKSYHKADEFVLFHVNVLRDYLQLDIRQRMEERGGGTTFDLERVIDDFVFMCFFIGNDFLPSIPTVGINEGSMVTMLQLYVDNILSRRMFLTNMGVIDWRASEIWLSHLGELELETLKARQQEEAEYQRSRARRDPTHEVPASVTMPIGTIGEYKMKYYRDKHGFESAWDPSGEDMRNLNLHFLEGLTWVIQYYYQGVPSWQWFYPHYYAPMASDLVNLPAIAAKVKFDLGKPFLPHQQLLAVLPPMSYRSIPKAYWPLLKSKSSPLARFFPEHIVIDRDGARAPWEGIVLIPFIEEEVLLAAYTSVQDQVDAEDAHNNVNGTSIRFVYDTKAKPHDLADDMFGPLRNVFVRREPYEFPPSKRFLPALCPGVLIGDSQLEGFSTLQSKRNFLSVAYEVGAVSIFGNPTKKESLLLTLRSFSSAKTVNEAASFIGREVLVGYPHYKRARIASLSDARTTLKAVYNKDGNFTGTERKEKNRDETSSFLKEADTHQKYMKSKLGIAVSEIPILVYVHRFAGMRVSRKGRLVRQFASKDTCYPLPLVCTLEDIDMREDSRYAERDRTEADMATGAKCVYVGPEPKNKSKKGSTAPIYGSSGHILTGADDSNGEYFTVVLKVAQEPITLPSKLANFASRDNWVAMHEAADNLGISARTMTTICSSLVTSPQYGSREIGLCLKFTGRGLARVGYAKLVQHSMNPWYVGKADIFARMEQDAEDMGHHLEKAEKGEFVGRSSINRGGSGIWYFSKQALKLVADYIYYFEPLVDLIESGNVNSTNVEPQQFMTGKWADDDAEEILKEIEGFVEDSGVLKMPMINATEDVFPVPQLGELETALQRATGRSFKEVTLKQVAKNHLYFPVTRSAGGHLIPLPLPHEQTFRLGARVVNCRATGNTPFGATGTIVRLLASGREAEVVYDVPFTGGTRLDGRLSDNRAAITKLSALLVLSASGSSDSHSRDHNSGDDERASSPLSRELANIIGRKDAVTIAPADDRPQDHSSSAKMPTSSPGSLVPKPRSAGDAGGVTTPSATSAADPRAGKGTVGVSLIASRPTGGINVCDLVSRLPGLSSPSTVVPRNDGGGAVSATTTPPSAVQTAESKAGAGITIPAPKSLQQHNHDDDTQGLPQQQAPARRTKGSRAIPDEFVSGRMKVAYTDSGSTFAKWVAIFTQNEIRKMLREETTG